MIFKENVVLKKMTRAIKEILESLCEIELDSNNKNWLPQLVVTSINDSVHLPNSRHYTNEAVDVRSRNFITHDDKLKFVEILKTELGSNYTVLFEDPGTGNEHIHIQVAKGKVVL